MFVFLYSKSLGTTGGFGAKADTMCVCLHVERDMTGLIFARDLFDSRLENRSEDMRAYKETSEEKAFALVPVRNDAGSG